MAGACQLEQHPMSYCRTIHVHHTPGHIERREPQERRDERAHDLAVEHRQAQVLLSSMDRANSTRRPGDACCTLCAPWTLSHPLTPHRITGTPAREGSRKLLLIVGREGMTAYSHQNGSRGYAPTEGAARLLPVTLCPWHYLLLPLLCRRIHSHGPLVPGLPWCVTRCLVHTWSTLGPRRDYPAVGSSEVTDEVHARSTAQECYKMRWSTPGPRRVHATQKKPVSNPLPMTRARGCQMVSPFGSQGGDRLAPALQCLSLTLRSNRERAQSR